MSEVYLTKWHISDYDGRRDGEEFILNGMKLYKCKRLSEWIRVDDWELRFRNVIWFLGGEWREFGYLRSDYTITNVGLRLEELLNNKNIFEVARQAENYANKLPDRMRWFYAALHQVKREVVDKMSDKFLKDYFSDTARHDAERKSEELANNGI